MVFPDFPGSLRAKKVLLGAFNNNRVPNAYLFSGSDMAVMENMASEYAKLLSCADVCGSCASCRKIDGGIFSDHIIISPEGKKGIIKIDSIRGLKDRVKYGPSEGKWLTVIIKNADRIEAAASNSFLKVLEEPPRNVLFMLISDRDLNLPQTIVSRCQRVFFGEGIAQICEEVDLPARGDMLAHLDMARDIAESGPEREATQARLQSLLASYYNRRMIKESKTVLKAIKSVKQMANTRLALDNMAIQLAEVQNG